MTLITSAIALIILVVIFAFNLSPLSDPYIQEVLSLNGDIARGNAIYQINCAGCHGTDADGNVGPNLQHVSHHKSKVSLIHQVISGNTPPMPKFQPSTQDMADLLSYLETL